MSNNMRTLHTKKNKRRLRRSTAATRLADIPNVCPAYNLAKALKATMRIFEEELRPAGVTSTQFGVLVNVAIAEPVTSNGLAERLGSDPSTVSRNMESLEQRNLVSAQPGADRRTRLYRLTDDGWRILNRAVPRWKAARRRVLRRVRGGSWRRTLADLQRLSS
jgi:DNA-binding MarR family transcriptional regulator